MILTIENLPDNVVELKQIIVQFHGENEYLKEQISLLRAKIFGPRAEKFDLEQLMPGQSFLLSLKNIPAKKPAASCYRITYPGKKSSMTFPRKKRSVPVVAG